MKKELAVALQEKRSHAVRVLAENCRGLIPGDNEARSAVIIGTQRER